MKICLKLTQPQAIQDVDELVSSSEQIWRNVELLHLLSNESSAVNGCRQNESLHDSSPSVNVLWSENMHVCKKQIHD